MTAAKRVGIIGAGISGLAHADVLTRCGFSVVLFDRAPRLGGVWACSHPTAAERFLHRRKGLVGGFWGGLQALFTRLAYREGRGYGAAGAARIKKVLPSHELLPDLRSAAALATPGYYRHVAAGTIEPHQAEVAGLSRDGVRLSAGEEGSRRCGGPFGWLAVTEVPVP